MSEPPSRLSAIDTLWSVVRRAHADGTLVVQSAQRQLLERYGGAVNRYLLASLRHEDSAAEVFQEFALRLLRGDFRNADPGRGRFRDFVKTCLRHLIVDYHRARAREGTALRVDPPTACDAPPFDDAAFRQQWRQQLLDRCWAGLKAEEEATGSPCHTVLAFRVTRPQVRSREMSQRLSAELGKPLTSGAVRMALFRARRRFAELLVDEVRNTLDRPTPEQIQEELLDLELLHYCREALDRAGDLAVPPPLRQPAHK
jgi:RNA polymerase sigma-70 factor (ECF subfamily)